MKDHPDIVSAEQTGYSREDYRQLKNEGVIERIGECVGCKLSVWTDEEYFETADGLIHDDYDCLKRYVESLSR